MASNRGVLSAEHCLGWMFTKGMSRGGLGEYDHDRLIAEIVHGVDVIKQTALSLDPQTIRTSPEIAAASDALFEDVGARVWPGRGHKSKPAWVADASPTVCEGLYRRDLVFSDTEDHRRLKSLFHRMVLAKCRAFRQNRKQKTKPRQTSTSYAERAGADSRDDGVDVEDEGDGGNPNEPREDSLGASNIDLDWQNGQEGAGGAGYHRARWRGGGQAFQSQGSPGQISPAGYPVSREQTERAVGHIRSPTRAHGDVEGIGGHSLLAGDAEGTVGRAHLRGSVDGHRVAHRDTIGRIIPSRENANFEWRQQPFRGPDGYSSLFPSSASPVNSPAHTEWNAPFSPSDEQRLLQLSHRTRDTRAVETSRDAMLDLLQRIDLELRLPRGMLKVNLARCISRDALFERIDEVVREGQGHAMHAGLGMVTAEEEVCEVTFAPDYDVPADLQRLALTRAGFRDQYPAFLHCIRQIDNGMDTYNLVTNVQARPVAAQIR